MAKLTLTDLANLANEATAVATLATNNAATEVALENTLSRDGTSPNQMNADFDMNSHRILNLPAPATGAEPLRLSDLSTFVGGGVVTNIPAGGNTGDVLVKTSNTNFAIGWASDSTLVTAGTNIVATGTSPVTLSTSLTPAFTTVNKVTITTPAASATLTIANTKTLTASNTLTLTGNDGASANFAAGGTVAYTGTALFQFAATSSAQLAGVINDETGSGLLVFATTPTLITPILGTPTSGNLANCTGYPVAQVTGLATGIAAFLATPSSANLITAVTDETGTGSLVFSTSPALLGAPTAPTAAANTNTTQLATTAFVTGGTLLTGVRLAKTGAYAVAAADKGSTVALAGTACYILSAGAASGYASNFGILVVNEDTGRGKQIQFPGITNFILWPGQTCMIFNDNNVWTVFPKHQPWMPETQPTFNVSATGDNTGDGLGTGTGAFQTLAFAAANAYANIYTRNVGSVVIDGGGGTFQEFVQVFYQLNGGGTLGFQNLTWKPTNSGWCLQFGDGAMVGLTSVTLSSAGVTTPNGFVLGHNYGVLDVNTSVAVTPTVAIAGDVFAGDGLTLFNINNGLTVNAGTITGSLFNSYWSLSASVGKSAFDVQGAITFVGTPVIGKFATCILGSTMAFNGSFSGANTTGVSLVASNGTLLNLSGATLPGGTPTPTTGGRYLTSTSVVPAWTTWAPTVVPQTGTITTSSAIGSFLVTDKLVQFTVTITITTVGTGANGMSIALPIGTAARPAAVVVMESAVAGGVGYGRIATGGTSITAIAKYDNTTYIIAGATVTLTGFYEQT